MFVDRFVVNFADVRVRFFGTRLRCKKIRFVVAKERVQPSLCVLICHPIIISDLSRIQLIKLRTQQEISLSIWHVDNLNVALPRIEQFVDRLKSFLKSDQPFGWGASEFLLFQKQELAVGLSKLANLLVTFFFRFALLEKGFREHCLLVHVLFDQLQFRGLRHETNLTLDFSKSRL